jgi:DNA topoisomerase I
MSDRKGAAVRRAEPDGRGAAAPGKNGHARRRLASLLRAAGEGYGKHAPRAEPAATNVAPAPDALEAAESAGLRYVTDASPGITRRRRGSGFIYLDAKGKPVRDADTLNRITHLVIPPAWRNVWICPDPLGHIQAVGRDDRGRKQYKYHERWRQVRDENKYGRMMQFVRALPAIRRRVARDLRKPGLPREKVLAAVVRLLETTFIRVGNEEYKKQNKSYGLTTIHNHHAKVRGSNIHFHFRGKSGVEHAIDLEDPRLAKIVRACQDLSGEELFGYRDDDGRAHDIGSADVNAYLQEITGQDFTAKDFRTWAGTVLAARALQAFEAVDGQARRKKNVVAAVESVAKKLGNTRAVCRKCYIHPAVIDSYLDGSFLDTVGERAMKLVRTARGLRPEEVAVLGLLSKRLKAEAGEGRRAGRRRKAA